MKTTYSISINQTDDQGQPLGNLSMTTSDQADLMRLLQNAGITGGQEEEQWSDDPADQGVCPVCKEKECGCSEVEEDYANEPKPEVVSTTGGCEYGEQRAQQDQRQVTARQGDNPIKNEDKEVLARQLEEQYLKEWASELDEAGYSAKAARAGKDIGKPGKEFAKIAKDAGERYGSAERGEKVAGAVLKKLRAKEDIEEGKKPDFLDLDKDGDKEEPMDKAAKEKKANPFKKEEVEEGKKPDFLDLDKDGDKEEPMDKAAKEKDSDKDDVKESSQELDHLKALIKWAPTGTQVKEVTEDMINQGTGSSELDWLKAVVKYKPN